MGVPRRVPEVERRVGHRLRPEAAQPRRVHGLAGRWLVNGSGEGIITITLEPSERGYVLGFPVRLRELLVSVADPKSVKAALTR